MASFIKRYTTCGLCGKFVPMIMRTYAKDGIICRSCEKRLRPAFPLYEGVRRAYSFEQGADLETSETKVDMLDPIEDETIESLRHHLNPSRYLAEEHEIAPVEDKDAYTVVLANIRRGQAVPVTKAVVNVCGIPLKEAWDLSDKLPATLGKGISCGEAQRWKRLIEAEGAIVELR